MKKGETLLNVIKERRSIRKYAQEPVDAGLVREILDAGRWAPSGLNNQPWKFLPLMAGDPRQEKLAECTRYGEIVRRARALVAVFLDREKMYHVMKDHQAAGACIQNMLLAAHSLGLGAVWLGEIVNHSDKVFKALGLDPGKYEFMALLAMGHPAVSGASSRKPLDDFLLEEF